VSIEFRKANTHHSSVNIATRPTHSQLNRLIILRLPLALPPYTTTPSTYISGLLHIAPIYITFEYLWQTILDAPRLPTSLNLFDACDPEQPLLDSRSIPVLLLVSHHNSPHLPLIHNPKVCSRTHSLLSHLRLPGLLRAGRLRADIRVLTGTPEHKIGEQLNAVSKNGRLAEFIAHTKKAVEANPHVLLAYAWVLYMALFSGGRYLRASLKEAGGTGVDFWTRDPSPVRPYSATQDASPRRGSISWTIDPTTVRPSTRSRSRRRSSSESVTSKMVPGMSFFNFVGEEDGEDIKREFKKRITEAEVLLTPGEKEDIVTEAGHIFKFMVSMVAELDAVMGTKEDLDTTAA
jgi:heme oxygenase